MGSGRPLTGDLAGTTLLYLDKRPLTQGPIAAGAAVDRLADMESRLRRDAATTLILEGGSISSLREFAQRTNWCEGWTPTSPPAWGEARASTKRPSPRGWSRWSAQHQLRRGAGALRGEVPGCSDDAPGPFGGLIGLVASARTTASPDRYGATSRACVAP
ncbi:isopentenyl transferase family protein [Streptomyces chartreusis]|uniref:isopentenyl transferase family protein n=1 Tax=Streptomyces chartreusis TaxID=1969 RepID=UPI00381E1C2F